MHKVALAAVACLSVMGLSDADADTSTRRPTHIPAQRLGAALQALAHDRQFYVLFAAQDIAGLQTQGVIGDLTSQEALEQLLSGTDLTFRFVDDKTVKIFPNRAEARLLTERPQLATTHIAWVADSAAAVQPAPAGDIASLEKDTELEAVAVIGSRGLPRTDVERPVPVDVVSGRELLTTRVRRILASRSSSTPPRSIPRNMA